MNVAARRRHRPVALLLAVALVAGLPACSRGDGPDKALKAFLDAWSANKLGGLSLLAEDGQALAGDTAQTQLAAFEGDLAAHRPKLKIKGELKTNGDRSTATVGVAWPLVNTVTWDYSTTVALRKTNDKWRVFFGPKTVHPDLHVGEKLTLTRKAGARGGILDGSGSPIVTDRPVVVVGVVPRNITDLNLAITRMGNAFASVNVDARDTLAKLPAQVQAAKPDAFVEVITLRREVYDKIRTELRAIPGTVFREATLPLAPSATFARALLGTTGEVTKEIMDKNPGKYRVGDRVGLSGLQQRYDDLLGGTPALSVAVAGGQGGTDRVLFANDAKAGSSLKTTLDVKTQNAAEAALATETRRSALVAVRVSDGAVLAVANGPGAAPLNLALTAQVPPGSTFKVVTALGVLDNGSAGIDTPVACPATLTVDGRTFSNAHDMALGTVPLRVDFAKSCNTAFAALAPKLGADGLADTAKSLGIGVPWDLGTDAFSGKVSTGGSNAERAAAAFGQGTTVVSPIALAGAAAAVARGQWKQPSLVTDPAPKKPAADGPQLKADSLNALRTMMREVVTSGTASSLKGVSGLAGKTGTAEYDSNDPTKTHSWFIGYRGDVAFAVFVENGGLSTDVAVPLAGKFLQALG